MVRSRYRCRVAKRYDKDSADFLIDRGEQHHAEQVRRRRDRDEHHNETRARAKERTSEDELVERTSELSPVPSQPGKAVSPPSTSMPAAGRSKPQGSPARTSRSTAAAEAGGHVFVSYSRDDQQYVEMLVTRLKRVGLACWIDKSGIHFGDRWEKEIQTALDACSVFVVVMTPAGEESPWVAREITRAENRGTPILPLLLDGEVFFRLSDIQYESVVGGTMPSNRWIKQVQKLVGAR